MNQDVQTISKYDRQRGGLKDIAVFTAPSTVKNVQNITGESETFVVETCRWEEGGGDYIFVECVDRDGVMRLALPPKVANAIARQRESLTKRRRSLTAKRIMQDRMAAGWKPTPPKRNK